MISSNSDELICPNFSTNLSLEIDRMWKTNISDWLKQILDAFNRHDLDAIMEFFSDDCSFDFPKGPESFGQRFLGKAQVREALAGRFKGIPDVHYGENRHWISADGNMGASEWTLTGTTTAGVRLKVRGCDLWEFRNGKITRKDSYWKIVERWVFFLPGADSYRLLLQSQIRNGGFLSNAQPGQTLGRLHAENI